MLQPFIAEPESPIIYVEENSTRKIVWQIIDCNWQVRVVTEKYLLYPNWIPEEVPIKNITDYNVTAKCVENHIIVNFSIFFNENVLDNNITYVACTIYRSNNTAVNFTSEVSFSSNINTETNTTAEVESSSNIVATTSTTTTGSGCKLTLHLITLSLGLIVTCLASFMWITDTD